MGTCLMHLKNCQEAQVAGAARVGEEAGTEIREAARGQITQGRIRT